MLRFQSVYRFGLLLILVTLLTASCAPTGAALKVESPAPVSVNETIRVPIQVQNIEDLTAIEIHLAFDPSQLEVVALSNGDFLQADFTVQNAFDNTAGTIDYAIAQINRVPASGSGTIMEVVFRAKASGSAIIQYRSIPAAPAGALLADSKGTAIQVELGNGKVDIK